MTDNQKIFNYLHKGDDKACWHEGYYVCDKCSAGQPMRSQGIMLEWGNPDYTTNAGFFLLLEGLRAKFFAKNPDETDFLRFIDCCKAGWCVEIVWPHHDGDILLERAVADDIRIALVKCTLALIEKDGE